MTADPLRGKTTSAVCSGCGKINPGPTPCPVCCGTVYPAEVINGRVYYTDGVRNEFGNLERMLAPEPFDA